MQVICPNEKRPTVLKSAPGVLNFVPCGSSSKTESIDGKMALNMGHYKFSVQFYVNRKFINIVTTSLLVHFSRSLYLRKGEKVY